MRTKEKISARQFTILVILYTIGTPILIIPAALASIAKQDGWIASALGLLIGLALTKLYVSVGRLPGQRPLFATIEHVLGKWLGKVVIAALVFFCLVTASEVLFYVGNFMTTQIMQSTPVQAFNIMFALVVVMAIYMGIETLARSAELLFPVFVLLIVILALFVTPQIHIERLQPVMETSMKSLVWATMYYTSVFSMTSFLLLSVFPSDIDQPQAAVKGFYQGITIAGIALLLIIVLCITVLGPDMTARQTYPSYALAKKINVGHFLQRIEIVMAIMWFITIFYRLCFYFYGAVLGLQQLFNLKEYRPVVLPLGMLFVALSLVVHPNVMHSSEYEENAWVPFIATFCFFLPLVLLGVHAIRKKK
ncbi:GerAB/ArcD/ProY family transporter [Paenibacillus paeoniae]|uniref:Spore gernimation protein n=1 Tax=Paenibacillus paeoniae TaxID=2292705 RepID=A0A371P776_9BACL|nr:endospore germination permease [Paenibacillus paeoniae]REK71793.1 spore gernimation protein [Paenibacillus paeoniae]